MKDYVNVHDEIDFRKALLERLDKIIELLLPKNPINVSSNNLFKKKVCICNPYRKSGCPVHG